MTGLSQQSYDSSASQDSQRVIHMCDFLSARDSDNFSWDETDRELKEEWARPVQDAELDSRKHKVFAHANKEFLRPPDPFVQDGAELGNSGSTIVYRVRAPEEMSYRRPMALKVIVCKENKEGSVGPGSRARKLALEEIRNMSAIRHPHIVVYVASFEDYCISTKVSRRVHGRTVKTWRKEEVTKHILGIAMYPPAQHNLSTFMTDLFQYPAEDAWKPSFMLTYFGCLAQAVAYLHKSSVRIRHKDIKPENVVIDEWGTPILTDFGLSKHFETGKHSEGPTEKTVKYADPEATHETMRDERSDVFSLGCVYLEMATVLLGQLPSFAEEHLRSSTGDDEVKTDSAFKYAECLSNLPSYLSCSLTLAAQDLVTRELSRSRATKAVLQVLPHIQQMMCAMPDQRPYAHELYPLFRPLSDGSDVPGPCQSCDEERILGKPSPKPTWPLTSGGSPTRTSMALALEGALTRSATRASRTGTGGSEDAGRSGGCPTITRSATFSGSSGPSASLHSSPRKEGLTRS